MGLIFFICFSVIPRMNPSLLCSRNELHRQTISFTLKFLKFQYALATRYVNFKMQVNNNVQKFIPLLNADGCSLYCLFQGEKEKNLVDVHNFRLTLPFLQYQNRTWTWLDLMMAVKKDYKQVLVGQVWVLFLCLTFVKRRRVGD